MNDPWPRLVDALSGKRQPISATWPVRKIYRVEGYVPEATVAKRRAAAAAPAVALPSRPG